MSKIKNSGLDQYDHECSVRHTFGTIRNNAGMKRLMWNSLSRDEDV